MEEQQKKKAKKVLGIMGIVLVTFAMIYLGIAFYFSERLLARTSVNGDDCAGMTLEEVETYVKEQVEHYELHVQGRDGITDTISGSAIEMQYHGIDAVEGVISKQNEFLWIVSFFEDENIEANLDISYNQEKLDAILEDLECTQKKHQKNPISARPVYAAGVYTIQEETYGSRIDKEKLLHAVEACISQIVTELDLDAEGCYVNPKYTKTSQEVLDAVDALNQCLQADITYRVDDIELHVDKEEIVSWISVNEKMQLTFDKEQMLEFTGLLAQTFDTPDEAQKIVTPTGRKTKVPTGKKGRRVGEEKERTQLKEEVQAGAYVIREPKYSQEATEEGEYAWGTTYIEVDIKEQHMWYFEEGEMVFESDVVTGKPGNDTPTGMFEILEKLSPKVLKGYLPNGKLDYETPVKYWARVTWTGIGFHDATWQAKFGAERYIQGYGSHGCINMPYSKAAELYEMISVGCPVIIHK